MPSSACDWRSDVRSEEHTSELQSHSEISYAGFCVQQKKAPETGRDRPCPRCEESCLPYRSRPPRRLLHHRHRAFFFNDTATTEIYTNLNTLSLHDALPI